MLASAIVAVGDTDEMIMTAANRFFSKTGSQEQIGTLTDLLTALGRRAINLLTHDQLFAAGRRRPGAERAQREAGRARSVGADGDEDEDPLAIIIKGQCSRELHDLGLTFKSLNIKVVVPRSPRRAAGRAPWRRRQRRHRAGGAGAARPGGAAGGRSRDLGQGARAGAAPRGQRGADRPGGGDQAGSAGDAAHRGAEGDADRAGDGGCGAVRVEAQGQAEAERVRLNTMAAGEAERSRVLADAQAEAIRKVNEAIPQGGEAYLLLRQLEMLPQIAPRSPTRWRRSRMVTVSAAATARRDRRVAHHRGDPDGARGTTRQRAPSTATAMAPRRTARRTPRSAATST